jgi:hypothetical protein
VNLAKIHHLATWTPEADPIEYSLDQIHQRLDNIEAGIDGLRATNDTILRIIRDGGTR